MSYNYRKLLGKIKEVYGSQENFAHALGIGRSTLSQKINGHSIFDQNEIDTSIKLLDIKQKEIFDYFFTPKV